jgi:putative YhdH/YhfP family quinone oxidoreductase
MSLPAAPFRAFRIHSRETPYRSGIETLTLDELTAGEVVVRVAWSSINYKDALAATGKGRILRVPTLVGGIDLAGHVVASTDPRWREGDAVIVTGCGLSETRDGGYAEYARVAADDIVPLPAGLTLREAMVLGTAGFTAGLALKRLLDNGQNPNAGPLVVTGATGGVGTLAIDILSKVGFEVHAITGKPAEFDFLKSLGATQCISRHGLYWGQRPLESATWAGAVDNVGGEMLSGLTRVIKPYGSIAVCGLTGGPELTTTVMPFIIRGVSLLGIASAGTPYAIRRTIWEHLADDWKPRHLDRIATDEVGLDELVTVFARMIEGNARGRTVVRLAGG